MVFPATAPCAPKRPKQRPLYICIEDGRGAEPELLSLSLRSTAALTAFPGPEIAEGVDGWPWQPLVGASRKRLRPLPRAWQKQPTGAGGTQQGPQNGSRGRKLKVGQHADTTIESFREQRENDPQGNARAKAEQHHNGELWKGG